jgi:hypothetical protein
MKNKKLIYGTIIVLGIYVLYKMFKSDSPIVLVAGGGIDKTPYDPNEDMSKYKSNSFDPIAEAIKDGIFETKVMLFQNKLNKVLAQKYPNEPQLIADGRLGDKTLKAIIRVFGDRMLPIVSKQQVEFLSNQLK